MIGHSIPEYIFIRIAIFALRSVAPLSFLYLGTSLLLGQWLYTAWLGIYASLEAAFYLFVYLPRTYALQKEAEHPPLLSRDDRQALFSQCFARVRDADMSTGWFYSSPIPNIKRDNVVEWILWALFNTDIEGLREEWVEEIDGYVNMIEQLLDHKLEPGHNDEVQCIKVTIDPIVSVHRPLLWYLIVAIVDSITSLGLLFSGFRHYTMRNWFLYFPLRILAPLSRHSPSTQLSYWYRPHRSTTKPPIVFLHGIGIGLWPYGPFLRECIKADPDVGIIAIENLHISMRISPQPLKRDLVLQGLTEILDFHHLDQFILVGHSYGTVISAHVLRDPALNARVAGSLLVDPIPFLLHLPSVAYNFVYRKPRKANEWQLWYFASRDPDIARFLGRHFFWADNILWKEDIKDKHVGVVLSGRDQIVDTHEVWRYLTESEEPTARWSSDKLEVLYYPDLDHSQVFDTAGYRRPMIDLIEQFSAHSSDHGHDLDS